MHLASSGGISESTRQRLSVRSRSALFPRDALAARVTASFFSLRRRVLVTRARFVVPALRWPRHGRVVPTTAGRPGRSRPPAR